MNGNPDTAADITQDVFLKLLENIQSVRKIGKFQNYLLTIAVNTCNNYTKKAKPLYMDLETLEDIEDTDNAFEKIELNELKAQIQYAINTLPDYQKEVIILRFYYDLKIIYSVARTKIALFNLFFSGFEGVKVTLFTEMDSARIFVGSLTSRHSAVSAKVPNPSKQTLLPASNSSSMQAKIISIVAFVSMVVNLFPRATLAANASVFTVWERTICG